MTKTTYELATFGGGCFWCTEAMFDQLKGIIEAKSGYSGGAKENPTYEEVCTGKTGHAEVIQIKYNPSEISYIELLEVFFKTHNPTTLNQQVADKGTQYRSVIFFHNEDQKKQAENIIGELTVNHIWNNPIVTEISKYSAFYSAEAYHQEYFINNPQNQYCQIVVTPKVEKFEKLFKDKLKK
ncbi:MAG: peptide-methionine (S)-S-oxide reductase MsrA [Salinivirgaceae bacterium]|nr:peptide-methionine (S)-S-oxide reductase MsrA [Salinivirgaceae bacterium]